MDFARILSVDICKTVVETTLSKLYEALESRRKYPRICINEPATFKLANDKILEVVVYNLSVDGIQIRCDRQTASEIHPSGKYIKNGRGPEGEIAFSLSFKRGREAIIFFCQAYYLTVIQETGEIAFGMSFKKVIKGKAGLIEQFIVYKATHDEDNPPSAEDTSPSEEKFELK